MTDDERGRLFIELKAARDKAKGDLCLARRQARQFSSFLAVIQKAQAGEDGIGWKLTESGLRFGPPGILDSRLPTEQEILEVLDTIQEYDEFVK